LNSTCLSKRFCLEVSVRMHPQLQRRIGHSSVYYYMVAVQCLRAFFNLWSCRFKWKFTFTIVQLQLQFRPYFKLLYNILSYNGGYRDSVFDCAGVFRAPPSRVYYNIIYLYYVQIYIQCSNVTGRGSVRLCGLVYMCDARAPAVPWNHGRLFIIIISFFFFLFRLYSLINAAHYSGEHVL